MSTHDEEGRWSREEAARLEARRLRLSEAVMRGDEKALEEDRRLELRIRELARRPTGGDKAERRGGEKSVGNDRDFRDEEAQDEEPKTVPVDPEAEQRELEAAGWEQLDVQGKTFWVNPESGHRYPQGPAIRRLRQQRQEDADREDA